MAITIDAYSTVLDVVCSKIERATWYIPSDWHFEHDVHQKDVELSAYDYEWIIGDVYISLESSSLESFYWTLDIVAKDSSQSYSDSIKYDCEESCALAVAHRLYQICDTQQPPKVNRALPCD